MEFFTPYILPPRDEEKNYGDSLVETAGYITAEQKILSMLNAGKRLIEARQDQYDYQEGDSSYETFDPTRAPNFDLSDAFIMRNQIRRKAKNSADNTGDAPSPSKGGDSSPSDAPSKTPPGVDTPPQNDDKGVKS